MHNRLTTMLITAILLTFFATSALATTQVDTSGLSPEQIARLNADAAKQSADNARIAAAKLAEDAGKTSKDKAIEASRNAIDLAKEAGAAFTAFAGGMGVAGDKFLESTTGKIIASLVIFRFGGEKVMGAVIHIGCAFVFLLIALPIWYAMMRREALGEERVVKDLESCQFVDGKRETVTKQVVIKQYKVNSNATGNYMLVLFAILFIAIIIIFTY